MKKEQTKYVLILIMVIGWMMLCLSANTFANGDLNHDVMVADFNEDNKIGIDDVQDQREEILSWAYYHVQDSDGTTFRDDVICVLMFEPDGIVHLYVADNTDWLAYRGNYSYSSGILSLKFTEEDFHPDVEFPLDLANETVTMPFNVLSSVQGASTWQRKNPCQKWDVNTNNKFDLDDIVYALQILSNFRNISTSVAQIPVNPCQRWDVNNNDTVDLNDVVYGLQVLAGHKEKAKEFQIILSSNLEDDLLFRVVKEDGRRIYYHGTTTDNTMRLTHIQVEDNEGNFQVIIFNSDLFPIQWIFTDMTAAIYTQGTHLLDSHNALHDIVYGEENNEIILTADIYPADLLTVISEMESQTGQKFDNVREFLNNFSITNFDEIVTLARQSGENQILFIIAASALSLSSAASSLIKADARMSRSLNPFGKLVEAGACAAGSVFSEWSKDKLDDEPGPLVDVLLCRGKTSIPHVCHYMFMRKGVMSCVRLCQTSMGCYTDICMPVQISADAAMNLEHDF